MEITGDLQVKQRELKILKFKTLFESPETDKKQGKGGSFVAASARAAYLGRSITKTSDDFNKLPLESLIADGKVKADQTLKHKRIGSHFSSGVLNEGEFDGAPPRRKTVGFKETRHDDNAVSGFIAVEDVESKKSHSIFERASEDFELQKSIVQEQVLNQTGNDEDPGAPQPDASEPKEVAQFHPKPSEQCETPRGTTTDQQAPEPALEQNHDEENNTNLLGLEDQEAQLLNFGRSSSTHKATRDRRRSGKNSTTNL